MAYLKAAILLVSAAVVLGQISIGDPCSPSCLDEHTGTYFPHPQNCSAFYLCSHRIAYFHLCAAGLEFNPSLSNCDYPEAAGCTADPDFDCSSDQATDEPATTAPEVTEAPDLGDPCAPDCSSEASGTFLPHPQNCSLFFMCDHGLPYLHTCPDSLEFNLDTKQCDYPSEAGCTSNPDLVCGSEPATTAAPEETTTEEPEEPTTEAPELSTSEEPEEPTTEAPEPTTPEPEVTTSSADCFPDCPTADAIFANPRDCTTYFQCTDWVREEFKCSFFFEYSSERKMCTLPEEANCTAGPDAPCVAVVVD